MKVSLAMLMATVNVIGLTKGIDANDSATIVINGVGTVCSFLLIAMYGFGVWGRK